MCAVCDPRPKEGIALRRVFAALSVRRYPVGCAKEHMPVRREPEQFVKKNARAVPGSKRTPGRDKIAVPAVPAGPWVYDLLRRIYAGRRG